MMFFLFRSRRRRQQPKQPVVCPLKPRALIGPITSPVSDPGYPHAEHWRRCVCVYDDMTDVAKYWLIGGGGGPSAAAADAEKEELFGVAG